MLYREYQQMSFDRFDQSIKPEEILTLFVHAGTELTRREIAARIGRSKSPSLVAAINRLVNSGAIMERRYQLPNGAIMYVYYRQPSADEFNIP